MAVFWILLGAALFGCLFLAWRFDQKNKARRAALQGQPPGQMQDVRGDVNAVRGNSGGHAGTAAIFTPGG